MANAEKEMAATDKLIRNVGGNTAVKEVDAKKKAAMQQVKEKNRKAAKKVLEKFMGWHHVQAISVSKGLHETTVPVKNKKAAKKKKKVDMSWDSIMDIAKKKDRARVKKHLLAVRKEKKDWTEKQRLWDKKCAREGAGDASQPSQGIQGGPHHHGVDRRLTQRHQDFLPRPSP